MSSCSATSPPQALSQQQQQPIPPSLAQPMAMEVAPTCTSPLPHPATVCGEGEEGKGGEAPNGQHHLLRHVLSAQQCSDAVRHFGTTDPKAAARMVNRMSQRELRDMFEKVYCVHTNSNNNTWLRRKLLEAVGASRRFYNAANKTGRPKGSRRSPSSGGGNHGSGGTRKCWKHATSSMLYTPTASSPALQHHQLHAMEPGPALPAGSPRALTQLMRTARAHNSGSTTALADCHTGATAAQQAHQQQPYQRSAFYQCYAQRLQSSEDEGTCSDRSGSEAAHHPRALAPHGMCLDSISPTSASAFASLPPAPSSLWRQPVLGGPSATFSMGSHGSFTTSQFTPAPIPAPAPTPAPVPPPSLGLASPHLARASSFSWDKSLPSMSSLTTLSSLLGTYPAAVEQQQQPLLAGAGGAAAHAASLQGALSADLGLLNAIDASMAMLTPATTSLAAHKQGGGGEEWLTWDDCQLPSLF